MVDDPVALCPRHVILPIIFIPGIMGSRLRNRKNKVVWQPGTESWDEGWNALGLLFRGGQGKRRMIVGDTNEYFDPTFLEVAHQTDGGIWDRGWGGLLSSYLPFLNWLNDEYLVKLDNCLVMAKFQVWAFPYNWTASNLYSASKPINKEHGNLSDVVTRAIKDCEQLGQEIGREVLKPIILTHSMGGLVARAFTQILGHADMVHGVIHGVMPTHGAPELYKRIRGGFEGATSGVLGKNAHQVTATAGNCAGPLELAPNKWHRGVDGRRDWLSAVEPDGRRMSLPIADPYSEIYENEVDYWRLIVKEYLNPGGDPTGALAFKNFLLQLDDAKSFHDQLGPSGFHPNTRMFYGTGRQTRDRVDWTVALHRGPVPASGTYRGATVDPWWGDQWQTRLLGPSGDSDYIALLEMSGPNAAGDGTVHAGSGSQSGQMAEAVTDGLEHQAAFDSLSARTLTVEWLKEMVEEMLADA
ncbi:esterase/lipase family protein [Paracoccus lutimaris]|uniref:Lecithin:cholesterol acyltransferase n=1 Tax=Paracoccus lutimaris TaxID=1490030 RepID=A0A368YBU4_9RHOB|nr:hypothetical protein [Paracoccus lutimaris]RCW77723.1 hypothetical protein DFP89_1613 [Paracoccus lutimaris]